MNRQCFRSSADQPSSTLLGSERGMTLIEVIAVVVLIGLIMTVVARGVFGKSESAKAQLNLVKMENISNALAQYKLQFNTYPDSLNGLVEAPADIKSSGQLYTPFLKKEDLSDVWKVPYIYKTGNHRRSYSLTSYGSDGVAGGTGPKQDVTKNG